MKSNNNQMKVLIVVTSHSQMGTTGEVTGYYLPEVSHPVSQLEKAGIVVDIASPMGGKASMDTEQCGISLTTVPLPKLLPKSMNVAESSQRFAMDRLPA